MLNLLDDDFGREEIDPSPVSPDPTPPSVPAAGELGRDGQIGREADREYGRVQGYPTSCAVVAAGSVIEAMTGIYYPEIELIRMAKAHGLYDEGTTFENFGKLLDVYEVPYHVNESGTMQDIVKELAYGRKVLVILDGPELWGLEPEGWLGDLLDWMQETAGIANHAVWTTAVDVSDPNNISVILNDSGIRDGIGSSYPLDEFIDAAKDSRFHYVATNEAAPGTFPHVGPDPDLAAFPEIKDYYEIRYSEKLTVSEVEGAISTSGLFASQSEFDIEKMPLDDNKTKAFIVTQLYSFKQWLQNEGARSGLIPEEVEAGQKLMEFEKRGSVPDIDSSPNIDAFHKYHSWVQEVCNKSDNIEDIRDLLAQQDIAMRSHTAATFEQFVSVKSTGSHALVAIDIGELKIGDQPLHHHFWEKFKTVWEEGPKAAPLIGFVLAVGAGMYEVTEAIGEIFEVGESPDGFVLAELGDDTVRVTWPDGQKENYSYKAFREAFEDSRFSYITTDSAPVP